MNAHITISKLEQIFLKIEPFFVDIGKCSWNFCKPFELRELKWYVIQPSPMIYCGTWFGKRKIKIKTRAKFSTIFQMIGTKRRVYLTKTQYLWIVFVTNYLFLSINKKFALILWSSSWYSVLGKVSKVSSFEISKSLNLLKSLVSNLQFPWCVIEYDCCE